MKLGVAGTGAMAKEALPLLEKWGWNVTALCGTQRSRQVVDELCYRYGIKGAYCDFDAMLDEADMEAVYIAVPNHLHYSFVRRALEKQYHVIVEKPLASNYREALELADIARSKNRYLFEAITTLYMPDYHKVRQLLERIGTVRAVICNFSQYSHRYDAFLAGDVAPVFDPARSGGALMDLNIYNLHYVLGLFGEPAAVSYHANTQRGIDTSGMLLLEYDGFTAVCIAAKDCGGPCSCVIQGSRGYISQQTPANACKGVTLRLNDGTEEFYDLNPEESRLEPEFVRFAREIASGDRSCCYQMLEQSLLAAGVQTRARLGAGICFPADEESAVAL